MSAGLETAWLLKILSMQQQTVIRCIVHHPDREIDTLNRMIGTQYTISQVREIITEKSPGKLSDFDTFIAGCEYLEDMIRTAISASLPVHPGTILFAGSARFQVGGVEYERTEKAFIVRFILWEI